MDNAVEICSLGKMYRLFDRQSDRVRDLFGVEKLRFWDREPKYREFWALRNVDLTIRRGERIGIIGRNGAGKSTLLKLVVGNLKPTEGSVRVHGKIQALLQMGTGFHPEFTGLENIKTALAYAGMDCKSVKRSIDEIIDFSELEDYIHQPVKYYSAGMYSRLAFAVATSLVPDILVIDEVLGAGDAAFTSKCAERMKHLTQDAGATVLFVSHSMDSVLEICERAILLERGEITHEGSALEVSKIYNGKIRYEEELRAKAKEYKVSRKSVAQIVQADESTQILIFRFVCANLHPRYCHHIYTCELRSGDEMVSSLHFGAPTDDDPAQFTHVIVEKGAMDWGPAKKDRGSFYRAYCDQQGSNCHAPFQMSVPMHMSMNLLTIEVNARPDSRESAFLEYFDGHSYQRLGEVANGKSVFSFCLPAEKKAVEMPAAEQQEPPESSAADSEALSEDAEPNVSEAGAGVELAGPSEETAEEASDLQSLLKTNSAYGSLKVVIQHMDILNAAGKSVRVFTTGEALRFQIEIAARERVDSFVAVICVMTRSGKTVTQLFCDSEKLGIVSFEGETVIEACLSPLRIGEGEYMVSIGLFCSCNMSIAAEEPSYFVADRALFFKVEQPFGFRKGLGNFLHICDWSCGAVHCLFDGTNLTNEG